MTARNSHSETLNFVRIYRLVEIDIANQSCPRRTEKGFLYSIGQHHLLQMEKFCFLHRLPNQIYDLETHDRANQRRRDELEPLAYEVKSSYNEGAARRTDAIRNVRTKIDGLKDDLERHIDIMARNGIDLVEIDEQNPEAKKNSKWLRTVLTFVGGLVLIDVYPFIVSFERLRDSMGFVDIAIRFSAVPVLYTLCWVYIARRKKGGALGTQFGKVLTFVCMVLTVVAPILLDQFFPLAGTVTSETGGWALTPTVAPPPVSAAYPAWVGLLRTHHYIPVVTAILYYAGLNIFSTLPGDRSANPDSEKTTEKFRTVSNEEYPLHRKRHLKQQIEEAAEELKELTADLELFEESERGHIDAMISGAEEINQEIAEIVDKLDDKKVELRETFAGLVAEFKRYEANYINVLGRSSKQSFLRPDWPIEQDLADYFQIDLQLLK